MEANLELYRKYDTCFLKWYSESMQNQSDRGCDVADSKTEYLRGNTTSNDCEALFDKYRTCLTVSCVLCLLLVGFFETFD